MKSKIAIAIVLVGCFVAGEIFLAKRAPKYIYEDHPTDLQGVVTAQIWEPSRLLVVEGSQTFSGKTNPALKFETIPAKISTTFSFLNGGLLGTSDRVDIFNSVRIGNYLEIKAIEKRKCQVNRDGRIVHIETESYEIKDVRVVERPRGYMYPPTTQPH